MITSSDRYRTPHESLCSKKLKMRTIELLRAAENMRPEDWRVERDLTMTKWFDYRFLTPLEATLQFADDYEFAYGVMWKRTFGSDGATLRRGIAEEGLFANRREFSTVWNARVAADKLGVRYKFFVFTTMETALRRGRWKRLPRPGQLWNKPDCIAAVQAKWEEELAGCQAISELAHYRPENFLGLPHQLDHQEHALRIVRKRPNVQRALGSYIDIDRVVSVAQAEAAYSPFVIGRARETVAGTVTPVPQEVLLLDMLLPGCFGLPVAVDRSSSFCVTCPLVDRCTKASAIAEIASVSRFGDDPVAEHVKALSRERSRQYRRRRRAAGASSRSSANADSRAGSAA